MIKIDLITGFLGSGKTTFIKLYAAYLMRQGQRIGILENDYGAVNVDMLLLRDLEGDNCGLEMVSGACDADCHRRRFKTKLIALAMSGFDRVLIEPSGIFDVDEFFDVLHESPLDRWYEPGSVITVADARTERGLSRASDYLLASQAAVAGKIVLSKTQLAAAEDIQRTITHLNGALAAVSCDRRITRDDVLTKPWSELDDNDFAMLTRCGYTKASFVKHLTEHDNRFGTLYYMDRHYALKPLSEAVRLMMADVSCGEVFRVKGFVRENGAWTELNATREQLRVSPAAAGQDIVIVIGENLNSEVIEAYLNNAAAAKEETE